MSNSDFNTLFSRGDAVINRIREEPLERLRRIGSDLWASQIADWQDLAKAEDSVRREYSGRYLFELLQNANDAIVDWLILNPSKAQPTHQRVRLELTEYALLIANDGLPFGEDNVRALCRLHKTTKSASKQIGHKGIGFKSVLEITDSPEVYSDRYAFGFDRNEFTAKVRGILHQELDEDTFPILRAPFARRLARLPEQDRERVEFLLDQGFVTVIRLPLKDGLQPKVETRMRSDLKPEVLLFLAAIDQLEIRYPTGEDIAYWRDIERSKGVEHSFDVILRSDEGGHAHIDSRWLMLDPKEIPITNRSVVDGLGEAWEEVKAVRISAAFPISPDGSSIRGDLDPQPFHVYFRTEEYPNLCFLINADFYLEAARKDIRRNALNDLLVEELAIYIASDGVEALKKRFPKDPTIVAILAPSQKPDREFACHFYDQYLVALSSSSFVPLEGGQYKNPAEIRFPPTGADSQLFRYFFPPSRLRGTQKWAFPLQEVEDQEMERIANGRPFLVIPELGASILTIEDLVEVIREGPSIPPTENGKLFRFLAEWWDNLIAKDRNQFIKHLSNCHIIPTHNGWKKIPDSLVFQANLRQEEDLLVPNGFDFEIIPLDVYGEERSYQGRPANFLKALGVTDYAAREILRRAILPILKSPERFAQLLQEYPNSIYGAYQFLKLYFDQDRSTTDIRDDLYRVPVPAYRLNTPDKLEWEAAGDVYFSNFWTENDALEFLFSKFEDVHFLGNIPQLAELSDPEEKPSWYEFFFWLGVEYRPRMIEHQTTYSYYDLINNHPFHDRKYWGDYLAQISDQFTCITWDHHGMSRQIRTMYRLDHFEELIDEGDIQKLGQLFQILGRNWDNYKSKFSVQIDCRYVSTGCASGRLQSYLGYCLKHIEWMPVVIWEQIADTPMRPSDLWNLGEDVRPEVRRLVPSLPDDLHNDIYRGIRSDLLKSEYRFEDYLELLQQLPRRYPLLRNDLDEGTIKKWQEAVRAVFNWIAQALQNSLVRMGDSNWPECPEGLLVIAFLGDTPLYAGVNQPNLVYPDNPFISREWYSDLIFLRIDESLVSFRNWLGIPKISDKITAELIPAEELEPETSQLIIHYKDTLPYFLSLVWHQDRFDRILSRLQRLDIHVLSQLVIRQQVIDADIPAKNVRQPVYLIPRDDPNPRGGMPLRAGDLYIAKEALNNPDILGGQIAAYIEIERLSDAFVLLYERREHEARMRFLLSKGAGEEVLDDVYRQLKIEVEEGVLSPGYEALEEAFRSKETVVLSLPIGSPSTPPSPNEPQKQPEDLDDELNKGEQPKPEIPEYPDLDLIGEIGLLTYEPGSHSAPSDTTPGNRRMSLGGGGGKFRRLPEIVKETLGKRGEQWAYIAERQRLMSLGLDPDALEREGRLVWVSRQNKYANHDIKSIDRTEHGFEDIYIEVKSSTGDQPSVEWSIGEFHLAASAGNRYWIYWVAHVDRQRPDSPVRYQNPVQLWQNEEIELEFRQLEIVLPDLSGDT